MREKNPNYRISKCRHNKLCTGTRIFGQWARGRGPSTGRRKTSATDTALWFIGSVWWFGAHVSPRILRMQCAARFARRPTESARHCVSAALAKSRRARDCVFLAQLNRCALAPFALSIEIESTLFSLRYSRRARRRDTIIAVVIIRKCIHFFPLKLFHLSAPSALVYRILSLNSFFCLRLFWRSRRLSERTGGRRRERDLYSREQFPWRLSRKLLFIFVTIVRCV